MHKRPQKVLTTSLDEDGLENITNAYAFGSVYPTVIRTAWFAVLFRGSVPYIGSLCCFVGLYPISGRCRVSWVCTLYRVAAVFRGSVPYIGSLPCFVGLYPISGRCRVSWVCTLYRVAAVFRGSVSYIGSLPCFVRLYPILGRCCVSYIAYIGSPSCFFGSAGAPAPAAWKIALPDRDRVI
jgi:hypothetical protein